MIESKNKGITLSHSAIRVFNALAYDIIERLILNSKRLVEYMNTHNNYEYHRKITSRHIQSSVRMVFPLELAKSAVSQGVRAVVYSQMDDYHELDSPYSLMYAL